MNHGVNPALDSSNILYLENRNWKIFLTTNSSSPTEIHQDTQKKFWLVRIWVKT